MSDENNQRPKRTAGLSNREIWLLGEESEPKGRQPKAPPEGRVSLSTIAGDLIKAKVIRDVTKRTLLSRHEAHLVAAAKRHPKHHVDLDGNHTIPVAARPLQEAIFIQLAKKNQPNMINKGTDNRWDAITLDDQMLFALTVLSRIEAHYNSPDKRTEGEAVLDYLDKYIQIRTFSLMGIVYATVADALKEAQKLPPELATELLKGLYLRIQTWRVLAQAEAEKVASTSSSIQEE